MKTKIWIAAVLLAVSLNAFAQKTKDGLLAIGEEKGLEAVKQHTIIDKDTLWDLAGKYYLDPFKWGLIYNANIKIINNPDLIYPGEKIKIPGIKETIKPIEKKIKIEETKEDVVVDLNPEPEPEKKSVMAKLPEAKKPTVPKTLFKVPQFSDNMPSDQIEWNEMVKSIVVPENWNDDGIVIGKDNEFEEDSLIFKGDVVKIRMNAKKTAEGDFLDIYKKGLRVYDKNGALKGIKVQKIARVKVIEAKGRKIKALVVDANSPVLKGHIVKAK